MNIAARDLTLIKEATEIVRKILNPGGLEILRQHVAEKVLPAGPYMRLRRRLQTLSAVGWIRFYVVHSRMTEWLRQNIPYVLGVTLLTLVACNLYFMPALQLLLSEVVKDPLIDPLRSLIVNLGGPLIGATAIVSSLVLFAMQVNIEHMPHGLFRRLSADARILTAFAAAFALAIGTACLSMLVDKTRVALAVSIAAWSILLILLLFLYAYRRALTLVNPSQQLRIVSSDAVQQLKVWSRRADRISPMFRSQEVEKLESELDSKSDVARATFFQNNAYWTAGAKRSISHAISFARHYAERGDYEVSSHALSVVLVVNAAYVRAKGRTFFAHSGIFEHPYATDDFLNDTLESLRQLSRTSVIRVDEQQIEQTLRALSGLVSIYLDIDYGSDSVSKTHANLAAGYLGEAVKSIAPANMPDVLMEGVRLMGATAQAFVAKARPIDMVKQAEDITMIGLAGVVNQNYRVVTMAAVEQLSSATVGLLRVGRSDARFALSKVRECVSLVADQFLSIKDTPLANAHSTYLAPYYSSTRTDSLRARLSELVNAVHAADPGSQDAKRVLGNLVEWSQKLPDAEKSLLLSAIKVQSHFTFDALHWIAGVTEILLFASVAPACDERTRIQLRKNSIRLIRVFDWIPSDKGIVTFVETFQLCELLAEVAHNAIHRRCDDVAKVVLENIVTWCFKAGKFQTGWGSLGHGLVHAIVFAIANGELWTSALKSMVAQKMSISDGPDVEARFRAAEDIRQETQHVHRYEFPTSQAKAMLNDVDPERLEAFGEEIALLLVPEEVS